MKKNIRLPPRVQLRDIDAETGSYPTITRTGDQNRLGTSFSKFDDTKVVIFSENTNINLPSTVDSTLISSDLTSITSSISTTGTVRKGIADEFVIFRDSPDVLRPFNDSSKLWQSNDMQDPFYATGSSISDVGQGFSGPLTAKTIIEIDMNPTVEYAAGIRNGVITGSAITSADSVPGNWIFDGTNNYPMMYYNFSSKTWEGIGRGIPTSITGTQGYLYGNNPQLSLEQNVRDLCYGFSPSYAITASVEGRQAAIPMSNFGFPLHPKFHATSSQLLDMSQYISHPFVLEKIVYEFSGSYRIGCAALSPVRTPVSTTNYTNYQNSFSGALGALTTFTDQSVSYGNTSIIATSTTFRDATYGVPISTFFILNQRQPYANHVQVIQNLCAPHDGVFGDAASFTSAGQSYPLPSRSLDILIPSATVLSAGASATVVNTIRDIITFAQVSPFTTTATEANISLLSRDLNIKNLTTTAVPSRALWAGSYVLSATIKSPVVNEQISYMYAGINDTSAIIYTANKPGGRAGTALPTGRDLAASVLGHTVSATISLIDDGFTATATPNVFNSTNNPYILLPTDKLIMGWQVPMGKRMFAECRVRDAAGAFSNDAASELTIAPGKGRLLLYGSLIRENKEFHQTVNQELTTVEIHEDIRSPEVVDQFLTEPMQLYSGSYYDLYMSGTMTNDASSRRVLASSLYTGSVDSIFGLTLTNGSENRARLPGFSRHAQLISDSERFYDTLMPRIDKIVQINGSAVYNHVSYNHVILGLDSYYSNVQSGIPYLITSTGTPYPDIIADATWDRAFPFEPKYSTVERNVDVVSNSEATRQLGGGILGSAIPQSKFSKLTVARVLNHGESLVPSFPITYLRDSSGEDASGIFPQTPRNVLLHLYGIGDTVSGTMTGITHWASRSAGSSGDVETTFNSVFRGFKYGILNALPEYTKAIFNPSHYGQFRDMFEQRVDAKYYDTIGYNSDGTLSGRPGETASPVQVKFVEPRSVNITSPAKTFSSNLSIEATSSMPYFDDQVMNRNNPLDLTELNSTIVSF